MKSIDPFSAYVGIMAILVLQVMVKIVFIVIAEMY